MRKNNVLRSAAVFGVVVAASAAAQAALITPGQTAAGVFEVNPVGGTTLITLPAPFTTSNYTGTLTTTVISGDTSNPFPGGLTFVYQLTNNPGSANALERLTVNGFKTFLTDMSYKFGTGNTAPTIMDRDSSGAVIGFGFVGTPIGAGTLAAGTSSELLVVQTNATAYTTQVANIANGAVTAVTSFGPKVVPEPTTITAGLAGLSMLIRRRRKA